MRHILCTAVGGQQFRKESRKLQTRIIFKRYYFFFDYCLLSCRYVMLQNSILFTPKWGAQAVVRGGGHSPPGRPVATGLSSQCALK